MYLHKLTIDGFKGFSVPFEIDFASGLNVLVGENATGKTAIIDAVRLLLQGNDPDRADFSDTSFYRPFSEGSKPVDQITISAVFSDLTAEEQIAFLPWTNLGAEATLTLRAENKLTPRGRHKRTLWGGASSSSAFEWELLDTINCAYLPPLRDAEARLREGRGSRLARLLRNLSGPELKYAQEQGSQHPLEERVIDFHHGLESESSGVIARANTLIRTRLRDAVGQVFGQDTTIRFSETNFSRIVESLRLLFFPSFDDNASRGAFRSLEENSLGYNNLIYLATVLAELTEPPAGEPEYLRLLLIEEPEAHLHPQLQSRLLKFIEKEAQKDKLQVIVTSHSPVLASSADIGSVVHISLSPSSKSPVAVRLSDCGLPKTTSAFISRWLDATKSTLLFAKGVILVEGIAEALLLPELAKRVIREYNAKEGVTPLPESLDDAGVSVINMNGIYFQHFMQLFCSLSGDSANHLPARCAGITDKDPPRKSMPTRSKLAAGHNAALRLIDTALLSANCRLYACELKTFEYDLAMEGENIGVMLSVLSELCVTQDEHSAEGLPQTQGPDAASGADDVKAKVAYRLLGRIANDKRVGKGFFAQALARKLASDPTLQFAVPRYIKDAILWVLGDA